MRQEIVQRFGERLQAERKRQGLRPHELAVKAGLSPESITNYESGRAPNGPSLGNALRIAEALGVRLEELTGEEAAA